MDNKQMIDYWYGSIKHIVPELWQRKITECTVQYLTECKVPQKEIAAVLRNCDKLYLNPELLPDSLYEDRRKENYDPYYGYRYITGINYLKRGEFYYHKTLMIRNPPPVVEHGREKKTPYYCEPRIRFDIDDVMDYLSDINGRNQRGYNNIKSAEGFLYSIKKQYNEFEPIDIFLTLTDIASGNTGSMVLIQNMSDYLDEALELLRKQRSYLRIMGMNKIVWRSNIWLQ